MTGPDSIYLALVITMKAYRFSARVSELTSKLTFLYGSCHVVNVRVVLEVLTTPMAALPRAVLALPDAVCGSEPQGVFALYSIYSKICPPFDTSCSSHGCMAGTPSQRRTAWPRAKCGKWR